MSLHERELPTLHERLRVLIQHKEGNWALNRLLTANRKHIEAIGMPYKQHCNKSYFKQKNTTWKAP